MGENTVRSFIKAGKEAITDVEFRLAFEELPQSLQEELEEAASSYKASFSVHYVENLRGYKRPPLESQNEFFSNGNYIATEPLFVQVGKNVPAFIISEEESVEKLNKEIAKEKIPPVRNKLDEELKHVVFGPGSNKKSSQRTLSKGPMRLLFMDTSKPTREEKRKSIKAYVADSKTLRSATEHEEEYFASRFLHCNRSRLLF
ncbi:uncharacterized protein LOC135122191 [Zophobas morio]|uniref:uncharacterized protein LOC135122191 n=1 Tax=Zophobas morio TaxID=2755281 RepID=UPI00308366D2